MAFDVVLEVPKQVRPYFLGAVLALAASAFVWHTVHSAVDPLEAKIDKLVEQVGESIGQIDHRLTVVETRQEKDE